MKNNAECNTIYRWRGKRKPGRTGGYGAVLQFVDSQGNLHEREFSAGYIRTTNNRMELMAVIAGGSPEPLLRSGGLFGFQICGGCL